MLKFEEYVARRKKENRLNEFDADNRIENIKVCVNYVFEYFAHGIFKAWAQYNYTI